MLANAGIAAMAFREVTDDEDLEMWTDVLNVNLVGAYHTAKAAIPHLIAGGQGGSIVFTSSTAGLRGFGGLQGGGLGYAASKHGIVGLMRTLANALAPQSIRVNTVHPTAVNTMMAVNPAMVSFLENYPDGGPHLQNPMPVELLEPEDKAGASLVAGQTDHHTIGRALALDLDPIAATCCITPIGALGHDAFNREYR